MTREQEILCRLEDSVVARIYRLAAYRGVTPEDMLIEIIKAGVTMHQEEDDEPPASEVRSRQGGAS